VVNVIERSGGRYQVQDVEFGRVYRWCPECVVVECDCGEKWIVTPSATTCGLCGEDHAAILREEPHVERVGDEAVHPWRYAGDRGDAGIPF
jgi:hypothetical protein